jgi:putative FmdB family regulatory protein
LPIYEYHCRACAHRFEALVRGSDAASCPECGSQDLERLLSAFAVSSEGTRNQALQDGRRRGAAFRKEKAHAQAEYEKKHEH